MAITRTTKRLSTQSQLKIMQENMNLIVRENTGLRDAYAALLAKLDADAANGQLNDTDYAATCAPTIATDAKLLQGAGVDP